MNVDRETHFCTNARIPGYEKHAISLGIKSRTAPIILTLIQKSVNNCFFDISDHSKDEEDDTCIEKNKITVNQPLKQQMGRI